MNKKLTQKEISLRNAISYCIENNDVNTATNRIMEFIRDEKEAMLPTSTQLISDCKKRFKELEGKVNLDYRSYRYGYLDSFSKNVVSKISQT